MKKPKQIISAPLRYSAASEAQYRKELRDLCANMLKEVSTALVNEYRENKAGLTFAQDAEAQNLADKISELQKKYVALFKSAGPEIAKRMVLRQLRYSRTVFKKVLESILPENKVPVIKGSAIPKDLEPAIRASIYENVSLIKSIPEQYFERVTGSVMRSVQSGGSIKQLKEEILKYNGMTRRRADIIAYDQTRKTFNAINLRNFQKYGIRKVKWIHSGGGQTVRAYHYRRWDGESGKSDGRPNGLNGFIFDLDNPPVIQFQKGKQPELRGYPAQLPNCKCVMAAVYEIPDL